MPWLPPEPKPCLHPERPVPTRDREGQVWQCPDCKTKWRVILVHYEPRDVNPGELSYDVRMEQVK